jgi:hypothetical protein
MVMAFESGAASEPLGRDECVGEIGEDEKGDCAAENVVKKHRGLPVLKPVAQADISERRREERGRETKNEHVHFRNSLWA